MTIWRPEPSKLITLAQDNPNYWVLCVSRSQYSETEIAEALAEIETVNDEWQAFLEDVYTNVLTDQDGEMDSYNGYASEAHRAIHHKVIDAEGHIYPRFSANSHSNCFPVRTWQADIARTRREMAKIRKMVEKI